MESVSVFVCLCLLFGCVWCKPDRCETCTKIAESFDEGLKRTAGANFGGGNSDWEETRLGSFANSETRLVDILDSLCERTSHDCNAMLEEHEEDIEEWWFKAQQADKALQVWLCENRLKVCCPKNTFGPDCKDCPGGVEKPCNSRGDCLGKGKRSGSGRCSCEVGYEGEICDSCVEGHFKNELEEGNCTKCHYSCALTCHGPGQAGCDKCKAGWNMTESDGCQDIDECQIDSPCNSGKYCVNTVGSYQCDNCHAACADNCTGPGPESCRACADGYFSPDDSSATVMCEDVDECKENSTLCEKGTYCLNTLGTYKCEVCDPACATACIGVGSQGCLDCATGYTMNGTNGCEDVNECVISETSLCDDETEECVNSPGSYECHCKSGYEKDEGKCIPLKTTETPPTETSDTSTEETQDEIDSTIDSTANDDDRGHEEL